MSTIPGFDFYGGSTVVRLSDATGVPYMSCCATRHSDGKFGFYVFKGAQLVEVPLTPFCTGRGSINPGGWWVAAQGKEWFNGAIPGFAPWPIGGADPRVDALVKGIAELGGRVAQLEAALVAQGTLGPKDRTALDRLEAFLRS